MGCLHLPWSLGLSWGWGLCRETAASGAMAISPSPDTQLENVTKMPGSVGWLVMLPQAGRTH